jgi:hypothetical protein
MASCTSSSSYLIEAVMVDLLLAAGQLICVIGLGYGFILVMIHADYVDAIRLQRDPVSRNNVLEINLLRYDSARISGVAADSDSQGQRSGTATHVD